MSSIGIDDINPIRYRGYYYDKGIGMYYLQSRFYEPGQGRFINADDPTMLKHTRNSTDGLNLFAYCNNDPINNTDPTGHFSLSTVKALATKIITIIKNRLQNYIQSLFKLTKDYVIISTGLVATIVNALILLLYLV